METFHQIKSLTKTTKKPNNETKQKEMLILKYFLSRFFYLKTCFRSIQLILNTSLLSIEPTVVSHL